jgi:hypothetical protein
MATYSLAGIAVEGFAPHGSFPTAYALCYAAAVALITISPKASRTEPA